MEKTIKNFIKVFLVSALFIITGSNLIYAEDYKENDLVSLSDFIENEEKLDYIYAHSKHYGNPILENISDIYASFLKDKHDDVDDIFRYEIKYEEFEEFALGLGSIFIGDLKEYEKAESDFYDNYYEYKSKHFDQLNINEYFEAYYQTYVLFAEYLEKLKNIDGYESNKYEFTDKEVKLIEIATNLKVLDIHNYNSKTMPNLSAHNKLGILRIFSQNESNDIDFDLKNVNTFSLGTMITINLGQGLGYRNLYSDLPKNYAINSDEIVISEKTEDETFTLDLSDIGTQDYAFQIDSQDESVSVNGSQINIEDLDYGRNEFELIMFRSDNAKMFEKKGWIGQQSKLHLEQYKIKLVIDREYTPEVDELIDGDTVIVGKLGGYTDITIKDEEGSNILSDIQVNDDKFEIHTNRPLVEDEIINFVFCVEEDNGQKCVEIEKVVKENIHKPEVKKVHEGDNVVEGKGHPGDDIIIKDLDGHELGRTTVDQNGDFTVQLNRRIENEGNVLVIAKEKSGKETVVKEPVTPKMRYTFRIREVDEEGDSIAFLGYHEDLTIDEINQITDELLADSYEIVNLSFSPDGKMMTIDVFEKKTEEPASPIQNKYTLQIREVDKEGNSIAFLDICEDLVVEEVNEKTDALVDEGYEIVEVHISDDGKTITVSVLEKSEEEPDTPEQNKFDLRIREVDEDGNSISFLDIYEDLTVSEVNLKTDEIISKGYEIVGTEISEDGKTITVSVLEKVEEPQEPEQNKYTLRIKEVDENGNSISFLNIYEDLTVGEINHRSDEIVSEGYEIVDTDISEDGKTITVSVLKKVEETPEQNTYTLRIKEVDKDGNILSLLHSYEELTVEEINNKTDELVVEGYEIVDTEVSEDGKTITVSVLKKVEETPEQNTYTLRIKEVDKDGNILSLLNSYEELTVEEINNKTDELVAKGYEIVDTEVSEDGKTITVSVLVPSSEGNTETPSGDDTDTPSGEDTEIPSGDDTDTPSGEDTEIPSGDDTDTPSGEDTQIPSGDDTDTPLDDDTDTSSVEDMDTPADLLDDQLPQTGVGFSSSFLLGLITIIGGAITFLVGKERK